MCLWRVTRTTGLPEEVTAWKVLEVGPSGELWTAIRCTPVEVGVWARTKPEDVALLTELGVTTGRQQYRSGFHAYENLKDARGSMWRRANHRRVFEVRLRGLICAGEGDGTSRGTRLPQWVAREILVVRAAEGT